MALSCEASNGRDTACGSGRPQADALNLAELTPFSVLAVVLRCTDCIVLTALY